MTKEMQKTSEIENMEHNVFFEYWTIASIFNDDFSIDWLQYLTGAKASQIVAAMENGVSKNIFIRKEKSGIYCFSDVKLKSKFLNKISNSDKKTYHTKTAKFMLNEISYDDKKSLFTIAHHLLQIKNTDVEKCRLLAHVGNLYSGLYLPTKALECYQKALSDLSLINSPVSDRLFIETSIQYSKISTSLRDTSRALTIIKEALVKANKNEMLSYQAILPIHIAKIEWLRGNYANALRFFKEGFNLYKKIDDPKLKAQIMVFNAFFYFWQGRFKEAIESYEQSVTDIDKFPEGTFPLLARITVGFCYANTGQFSHGLGMMHAAYKHSLDKKNYNISSTAAWGIASVLLDLNQRDNALEFLNHGLMEAKKCDDFYSMSLILITLAYIYYLKDNIKRSLSYLNKFLKLTEQSQTDALLNNPYMLELTWAMHEGKYPGLRELTIERVIGRSLRYDNIFVKGVALRYQAYIQKHLNSGYQKISKSFEHSFDLLEMSGHKMESSKTQVAKAQYYLSIGDQKKAKSLVQSLATSDNPHIKALVPDLFRPFFKELNTQEKLLEEVLNLGREVVSITEMRTLFNHIIATVNRITGAERGAIFFFNEQNDPPKLQLRASKNLTLEQINHSSFKSSMNMITEVAETGVGRILCPEQKDENIINGDIIYSRICVPMILRKKIVGVLYHDNRLLSNVFENFDLKLLSHFAAFAALAMTNNEQNLQNVQFTEKVLAEKSYLEEQQNVFPPENIIGSSTAMTKIYSLINQVAPTDTTVLIQGETGVGKELIARAIYRQSDRKGRSYIRVHSQSLPETLIHSEFFGHEKGAFTGAVSKRIGRFELADQGTLFLDEIGELSLEIQVRLLRVLQTKEFERVGGRETLRSDFRLIVATNRNLEDEVKSGRFRSDLYYRLNVFPITIPPLRERIDDLPKLVTHFIKVYSIKKGKTFKGIADSDIYKLMNYSWPGNVRELENIIERAIILSKGPFVQIPDLVTSQLKSKNLNSGATLRENEYNHILWALGQTKWRISGNNGAAKLLDINPSTLQSRMKKLGIKKPKTVGKRKTLDAELCPDTD